MRLLAARYLDARPELGMSRVLHAVVPIFSFRYETRRERLEPARLRRTLQWPNSAKFHATPSRNGPRRRWSRPPSKEALARLRRPLNERRVHCSGLAGRAGLH